MRNLLIGIIFILVTNKSYADINVDNCDDLEKKSEKINCLTKLKAKALKENSTNKAKIIQDKLSRMHNKLGQGVENTEKGIASTGKKIGEKINETDKGIREKSRKTFGFIKEKFKKKE